jgi:release factor glutamine methyltransferase
MCETVKISEWLYAAKHHLSGCLTEDSTLSAQVLLAEELGRPRAWLLAHPDTLLDDDQQINLQIALNRLAAGTPLPYLTGKQAFYGLDFFITPDVLIPRPETELLVEQALVWLNSHPGRRRAADVGTGSGCIAISLAAHQPDVSVIAVDRSWAALQVTRQNAARYALSERVHLLQSNLLSAASGPFDLVCANLPYIPTTTLNNLAVANQEPLLALDGGTDGLQFIAALLADAPRWIAAAGALLLEIEAGQGDSAARLAAQHLPQAAVNVVADLAGLPRLLFIQLPDRE